MRLMVARNQLMEQGQSALLSTLKLTLRDSGKAPEPLHSRSNVLSSATRSARFIYKINAVYLSTLKLTLRDSGKAPEPLHSRSNVLSSATRSARFIYKINAVYLASITHYPSTITRTGGAP